MDRKVIEVKKLRGDIKIIEAEQDQVVYISDVFESQIYIKGRCMKIVGIDIRNCFIEAEKVITLVEVARAKNSLVVLGDIPMAVLEDCSECRIGASSQATELRIRRSSSMSFVFLKNIDISTKTPDELDSLCQETKEELIPEEIRILIEEGKINSSIVRDV